MIDFIYYINNMELGQKFRLQYKQRCMMRTE